MFIQRTKNALKFWKQYSENDKKLPLHKINLQLITIETRNDRHNSQTSHLSTRTKYPQTKKYTFHLHVQCTFLFEVTSSTFGEMWFKTCVCSRTDREFGRAPIDNPLWWKVDVHTWNHKFKFQTIFLHLSAEINDKYRGPLKVKPFFCCSNLTFWVMVSYYAKLLLTVTF